MANLSDGDRFGSDYKVNFCLTNILKQHADATFFPNIPELLKILSIIPVGSGGGEVFFLCKTDPQLTP